MAVASDFTLSSTPDISSAKSAFKAPSKPAESIRSDTPRFSDVYAKEQQPARNETRTRDTDTKSVRRESSASPKDSRVDDSKAGESASSEVKQKGDTQSADYGKALPIAEENVSPVPEVQLDPLLLLGMTGALPAEIAPVPVPNAVSSLTSTLMAGDEPALLQGLDAASETDTLSSQTTPSDEVAGQLLAQAGGKLPQTTDTTSNAGQASAGTNQGVTKQTEMMNSLLAAAAGDQPAEGEASLEVLQGLKDVDDRALSGGRDESFADKLNSLSQAMGTPVQTARPVAPTVPGQPLAMNQSDWHEGVIDRVMWMSSQNLKSADIRLEPAGLGRLEVRIDMTSDQAQVTFASPHADVRDALDSQSQRLRDMFLQQGMTLDVNVSDQSTHRDWQTAQQDTGTGGRRSSDAKSGNEDRANDEVAAASSETVAHAIKRNDGVVDFYA
ncbi:flagellar hook-length control protein FliK [Pseudomonas asuensis]|uniref:Flagellar hook-length control protein FliK n=1 Tax=Pseudomonas asuensis TaxID=1825787 RepID=A0ABQ2GM12_9PSED|nr:flagellar hook-length control protein FliK [Pseudomonas asuensis]GGM03063.1 flagellar hook-length control protein FliK [Pseudomonas asuensis]